MNKKFLVVALMAALSTVGYAEFKYEGVGANKDGYSKTDCFQAVDKNLNQVKDELGRLNGEINQAAADAIAQGKDDHFKQQAEIDGMKEKLDKLPGEINQAAADAIAQGKDDHFKQQAEIDGMKEKLDKLPGEINQAAADAIAQGKDDHFKQQAEIDGLNTRLEGYEGVKENAESGLILAQKNENSISDLYANKVDNSKFEEHKKQQEEIDKKQNADIEANKNAITETNKQVEANKNAIAETNKQVETNKNAIASNSNRLDTLEKDFAQYDGRLSGLEKKVDNLDNKMNKGLSLMAAMNAVDFQNVQTGEMALGAGIGHYGNAQSVALGVAYSPVQDLTVNAKYSVTAGDVDSFALGAGATYKFKVGR